MKVDINPGVYVIAVSGGVDSITLLDILATKPKVQLVVAHFDHGMRADSEKDRLFVQKVAEKYGLPFVFTEGNLGAKASEANAREARYKFLEKTKKAASAEAIITAHHQDDVLETAIINMLRGTGRRGLTALKSGKIVRPLLNVSKKEILEYAKKHKLNWREDPTNVDTDYLRNYVRSNLLPKFDQKDRQNLLQTILTLRQTNKDLDELILDILKTQPNPKSLDRHLFIMLSHSCAKELMAEWLRQNDISNYSSQTLERLVRAAKTYKTGKKVDVSTNYIMIIENQKLIIGTQDKGVLVFK